jgi:hypothetical protein
MATAPWTFRIAIAAFVLTGIGLLFLLFAGIAGGWNSIGASVIALTLCGVGLVIGSFSSLLCALTEPSWRQLSIVLCLISFLPIALFFLIFH